MLVPVSFARKSSLKGYMLTIIIIIAYYQLLQLSVLAHFTPDVLIKCIEVILQLARIHLVLRIVGRVLVHVRH